jgi:hypothetical protein
MEIKLAQHLPYVIEEFEKRIGFCLPHSYRTFMIKKNGGEPERDYFELPRTNQWPFRLATYYSFENDHPAEDIWDVYCEFKTELPRGLIKIGTLGIECAEICLDYRRHEVGLVATIKSAFSERSFLDGDHDDVPIKLLDWMQMWNTGKWRESDCKFVAENFEAFVSMLRYLTIEESDHIKALAAENVIESDPHVGSLPTPKPILGRVRPTRLSALIGK